MTVSWLVIQLIIAILVLLDGAVLAATFIIKRASRRGFIKRESLRKQIRRSMVSGSLPDYDSLPKGERAAYLLEWYIVQQSVCIPEKILSELRRLIIQWEFDGEIERMLGSRAFKKRADAVNLTLFLEQDKRILLLHRLLEVEPVLTLRLKVVEILCEADDIKAFDAICKSMEGSTEYFKRKVLTMLKNNIIVLLDWSDANRTSTEPDARRILIQAARTRLRDWHLPFLMEAVRGTDATAAVEAADVVIEEYREKGLLEELIRSEALNAGSAEIRSKTAFYYFRDAELPDREDSAVFLKNTELHSSVVSGLTERLQESPRLIPEFFQRYLLSADEMERKGYAEVLSTKIRYFISRLKNDKRGENRRLINDLISLGISAPIINFLNSNKNLKHEKQLLETITPHLKDNSHFLQQCQYYLNEDLKTQLSLPPLPENHGRAKIQLKGKDRLYMIVSVLFVISLPLAIFILTAGQDLPFMTGEERLVSFIIMYHYIFAFYTIAINSIYLFLLSQSWVSIRRQQAAWHIADKKFLYTKGILPSVSVLAPAYNEETTIVQNVHSLLSLEYPQMELIVINDGSSDGTMKKLKEHFDLRLSDYLLPAGISTAPIVGVYRNSRIPNLVVIDKQNGGKADALNTGLNAAGGEFICSIDADSLLEPEALTKLMFQSLIDERETVAVGGNIIPVNGCITKDGAINEIHLAPERYSRFQTIEYLRSFITGRLGWARLNSLMIISGAFGAFRRRDVLNIGGYMTGTGSLGKDTVGEDMELVVRLVRSLKEKKEDFHIDYAHNANCWTEVPENLSDLLKQRDRWHRGLIEIMLYHKAMLFNKKYGAPGLVAFPYFLIFELLGPFWEFFGYIVLLLSLVFGLLSSQVFLFMFSIVVLLGILISSSALFLAEHDILYFQGKEFRQGILTVIGENFGYRQFISMHRIFSFVAYIFRNKGWQKFGRKGFSVMSENKAGSDEA